MIGCGCDILFSTAELTQEWSCVPSFSSMPSIMSGSIGIVAQFVFEHIRRVCRYG